ncbi:MAG TPA: leucyl/phenylalanyl-tRNA--protein transferase [Casimicrobiaceae bacterium]|nr:leucyl/phenylalanyl-tRNA--protein transferase [Casimicrobiaceae bacterium]
MIPWIRASDPFPPLERALDDPNGLIAAGGSLEPERLLDAYRHGIFPWSSEGQPILWWSPDPRMVLFTNEFNVSRSLRKVFRAGRFEMRIDAAVDRVIAACGEPRDGQAGTWITPQIRKAYVALHQRGYVHSIESWRNGRLVGGLYGVTLGRVFFGESMFARETDASKVAFAHLIEKLRTLDVPLVDCQQETTHLASLGARSISRARFSTLLRQLIHSLDPPEGWAPFPSAEAP